VQGRRDDLARLVGNLLANAARHAATTVTVSLGVVEGEVLLAVEDDGPGIPRDRREEVFERFARGDPARGHDGGSGLGLAISRAVVLRHGGTVRVADAPGGARLEVRLPAP
ncbi:MAG: sensor histidine kinase, partial [Pedococcus sp.]